MLGEVRASTDPDNLRAEFAIMVRSDLKGRGLGQALLSKLIRYLKGRGTGQLAGECLRQNEAMAALARSLGFGVTLAGSSDAMSLSLDLQQAAALPRTLAP